MTLKQYKNHFKKNLSTLYPIFEIDSFFFLLIEEYMGYKRIDSVLKSSIEVSSDTLNLLNLALEKLEQEEPIQYIIGKTMFYGFPFLVSRDTLIPRTETEELITAILNGADDSKNLQILDIGTGSGCIPISLIKHLPKASICSLDISEKALKVAKKNSLLNNVQINFIQKDILKTEKLLKKYDIIVSNPPYVRESEKKEIKNNVLKYEPHKALFVKDNIPLVFYDKIAELAKNHLTKNGTLFFEINQYLGKETVELIKLKGFNNIELKKDIFGHDRIIIASL